MSPTDPKLQKFVHVFSQLNGDNLDSLFTVYDESLHFEDPAHSIKGLQNFHQYMANLYAPLKECYFDINDCASFGNVGFISWTLNFTHPKFNQGRPVTVEGSSKVHWRDGMIVYHRDYFDLGEMLYEKLPLIGRIIKAIKNKLGSN